MATNPSPQQPVPPRRTFREAAIASGLVTAAEFDAAEAIARARLASRQPPVPPAEFPRLLEETTAAVLVEQGKFTRYQVRELRLGHARFHLGQYTVIDEVGRGGMGYVFKAEHALMGRHVAVKVLPRSKATPDSEAAFRREMRILGRLDHENLVRAFDAGYDASVYYLVMELVPGIDLRRQIRKHGPIDTVAAASVFSQVARGLAFAHAQKVVHRDVKPGNILVMDDGRAKLLDLGLAGSTLEAEAQRLGRVVGTMDYIAPEQARCSDDVGPPADIYSLGCSMYFALTGKLPFPGGDAKDKRRRHILETPTPIQQLAPHLPRSLCQVIEAMMVKSVADRIGSAEEVIRRLAPWTPERPVPLSHRDADAAVAVDPESVMEQSNASDPMDGPWSIPDLVLPPDKSRPKPAGSSRGDDGLRPLYYEALDSLVKSRTARTVTRVIVPAAITGAAFAAAVAIVRTFDPKGFNALLGNEITPWTCGWAAFLLMAAVQAASHAGRRRR